MVKGITLPEEENAELLTKITEAKEHYRQVIDAIEDDICVINRHFRIVSSNRSFAAKVGLDIKDVKGREYREVMRRYDRLQAKHFCCPGCPHDCALEKVFVTGHSIRLDRHGLDPSRRTRFYVKSVFPIRDSQRQISQLVITIRDITDLNEAHEKIRLLSEFNQRVIDAAPMSIVVLDKKGAIYAANERANRLMAGPEKTAVGRNLFRTKELQNNKTLRGLYHDLFLKGKAFAYDSLAYFSASAKAKKSLNIIAVPLFDRRRVEAALSMAIDNTEIVKARHDLNELNRDLEEKVKQRTKELDAINKRLNRILELQSKFIADASHELRTPLTVAQGNLELAVKEATNSDCAPPEIFGLVLSEVERMSSILTDLTMLTNMDAQSEELSREKINLGHLIRSVGQSLKILADQKKINLIYKKGAKRIFIIGDEAKLEKVLLNIVRNAIKYTDPKGRIKIWAEADENEARLNVVDNGIGIPKKDLPFIFERFYRVDKARSRAEGGTGLGLSIAKGIVEAHRGQITVTSALGKGSKFTVHLPYDGRVKGLEYI